MKIEPKAVNLIFPESLSPESYHALAHKLITSLKVSDVEITRSAAPGQEEYLTLSRLAGAPPVDVPVLNDSTGTLYLPLADPARIEDLKTLVASVPGAERVVVEAIAPYSAD
jgi:hypothetical protein